MAPAIVLQGAVREQGFTSSPTPEIQVRVVWAFADVTAISDSDAAPIRAIAILR